ncbi:MAG: UDP-N-acetylmuramoyl-tripeptide--D-alanyl-D-alanine ligase [Marinifilaceae bacterium]
MLLEQIYQIFQKHPKVITDSRNIEKDAIFFALKGANFNGNKYALSAIEQGCSYAIVDEAEFAKHDRCILVDNVLMTLQGLGRLHRRTLGIPIIGITGTNGKTTTKELLHVVLSRKFRTYATQGNFNNHIGVPLTLLAMDTSTEFGIVEMGANHPGEIKELCEIAEPDFGIITNVGKAHLEGFGSFDGVKKAKSELYDYLGATNGKIFVNADNHHLQDMLNGRTALTYGNQEDVFSKGRFLQSEPFMVMELRSPIGKLYIKTRLIGAYNFENAMAAVAVGRYFQMDEVVIKKALEEYEPQNNRSQLKKTERNVLIMDAYNANPTSMHAAVSNFSRMTFRNKALVLGDMLELGSKSKTEHQAILELLKKEGLTESYLVGSEFCSLSDSSDFMCFERVEDLVEFFEENPVQGKYILIKGSRGIHLEKITEIL